MALRIRMKERLNYLLTRTNNNSSQLQALSYKKSPPSSTPFVHPHNLFVTHHPASFKKKSTKAPGVDSITNTAIKLLPRKSVLLLTHIFNGCLRIGHFPTSWKYAIVITIPKPGKDHRHPVNYRPIALLSSLSKVHKATPLFMVELTLKNPFTASHSTRYRQSPETSI